MPRLANRELFAVVLGLAVLGLVMCFAHIARGGSYFDDWSLLEMARFPPPGGLVHGLWLYYGQRPGQVLYYAALSGWLGSSVAARLALAAVAVTLQAGCLYALLRQVGLRMWEGFSIAALTLLFPFSDSGWLWDVVSLATLSVAAGLLGVILALRALRSDGTRRIFLHAASLALFLASVLSYEVFAVAGCLAGLLYVRAVGWRRARIRWIIDVLTIVVALAFTRGLLPVDVATPSRTQSLSGMIDHAGLVVTDGLRLAGSSILPIEGVNPWIGTGLLASILAGVVILGRLSSTNAPLRREIARAMGIAGVGVGAALAAWAVYLPAPNHYSPIAPGTVNRMNVLAAAGIAMLTYSCSRLAAIVLAHLVGRVSRSRASIGTILGVCTAVPVLALGGAYLQRTSSDARAWDRAAADQQTLLAALHESLPKPGKAATIYVVGAPRMVGPNVPVLSTALDLTSAVRISYGNGSLLGIPVASPSKLACGSEGPLADGQKGNYGDSYLVDASTMRAVALVNRGRCVSAVELSLGERTR